MAVMLAAQPSLVPFRLFVAMLLVLTFGLGMTVEVGIQYLRQEAKREADKNLRPTNPKVSAPRFHCKDVPEMREACKVQARMETVTARKS